MPFCDVLFGLLVELDGERAEKESIQSRIWGLQRNIKLLQSERDVLEDKMKDAISTFSGVQNSLDKVQQPLLQKAKIKITYSTIIRYISAFHFYQKFT